MKQQIIILSANPYSINDERTGRITEGVSVYYLTSAEMEPVFGDNGSLGVRPAKGSVSKEQFSNISAAPALYDADLEMSIDGNGRPVLKLKTVQFLSAITVSPVKKEVKQ